MVSVGQPLDVAVTLPQRCGGRVSESCGPERVSSAPLPRTYVINLITLAFAWQLLRVLHLEGSPPTARRECVSAPK